jgi:hypothetical protein
MSKYNQIKLIYYLSIISFVLLCSQYCLSQGSNSVRPNKVVKLKTTVTPRKSNVVFVGKAMEVIITPLDESGSEIKEIPSGLNVYLSLSDSVKEKDRVGLIKIFGKTYLYLTPQKVHDKPDIDVLKVGAFLIDSINGQLDIKTGEFNNVLVANHFPVPPDVNLIKIRDESINQIVSDDRIRMVLETDKFTFFWPRGNDSCDLPLKKSFALDPNDTNYWIQDQCKILYTLRIEDFQLYFKFLTKPDTVNQITLTVKQLQNIFLNVRVGPAKSAFVKYSLICEDDVYKFGFSVDSNKLITDKKRIEIIQEIIEDIKNSEKISLDYYLAQNYPNPFNPSTNIKYTLPKESYVKLIVYDVFGRQVRTLVSETQSSGYKNISWNGKNDEGMTVSSGTYIYTITAGDFVKVKKMHLIK